MMFTITIQVTSYDIYLNGQLLAKVSDDEDQNVRCIAVQWGGNLEGRFYTRFHFYYPL